VTRIERSLTLDGTDVVAAEGDWERTVGAALDPTPGGRGHLPTEQLPESHDGVVRAGRAHLGVSTRHGPVALPATWSGDGDRLEVSAPALRAVGAELPGPGTAVFDDSASRRPDEKMGVMLRGTASLADLDRTVASVQVRAERITTWDGFRAGTVAVER
jgi:hypothetical protein